MLNISLVKKSALDQPCDVLIVYAFKETPLSEQAAEIDEVLGGLLTTFLKQEGFKGKMGEWVVLPCYDKLKARKIGVLGLGEKSAPSFDIIRKIGGHTVKRAREAKAGRLATVLPMIGYEGMSAREIATAFVEGMWLGAYRFDTYKGKMSQEDVETSKIVKEIIICEPERAKIGPMERGMQDAKVLAQATTLARDLVNTPSAHMAPEDLVAVAKNIAKNSGRGHVSLKTLNQAQMKALGMEAVLAVGRGSEHQPLGAHLIFRPKDKPKKRVAIVGKAVTFDSGGLSIKPADGMMTMKIDMAGAAAVLGLFQALPYFAPNVEVHGIFLAVENMPSGRAYRPGDVVKAMNGNTIEILNTDAEGRVTLADALSYAARLEPDVIIDLATLTGACVVALGEEIAGLMSNNDKLSERLLAAAKETGEELWRLPLFQPYQELIKSKIADIKNIGGRSAGTITAGLFLSHFVGKIPWAHLDIAGPSYAEKETRPDIPFGGTGYGVRLLMRYLQGLG